MRKKYSSLAWQRPFIYLYKSDAGFPRLCLDISCLSTYKPPPHATGNRKKLPGQGSAMSDAVITIANLRETVRQFVAEREWEVFHSPKNLAMSLAIEAAELMEHF